MVLSAIIVVPALVARYKLADSPLFEHLKQREQLARMPSFGVLRNHAIPIILLATVSAFQLMDSVVSGTYAISFMRFAGIPLATTATIIFFSRIGDVLGVLSAGLWLTCLVDPDLARLRMWGPSGRAWREADRPHL